MIVSAGGVVYRTKNREIEVKLITTKSWKYTLPKGRVEQNESVEDSAIREVKEEAGVEAKIESFLGTVEWKLKSGEPKVVYIYLMQCLKDGKINDPDNETIDANWYLLDQAIELVTFPPMRKMLIRAMKFLVKEKADLCLNCFKQNVILLEWCKDCLKAGQEQLEKKYAKQALKGK